MDVPRGAIRNREFAAQLRDYSGLRYGKITPTDYDLVIEYHNICWIYCELKYENAAVQYGQRLAIERQCDDMQKVKPTVFFIASHNSSGDIDAASAVVTEYRYKGRWRQFPEPKTVKQAIDSFIKHVETERLAEKGLP